MTTKIDMQEIINYDSKWDDISIFKFMYNNDYNDLQKNIDCIECKEYYYSYDVDNVQLNNIDHCLVSSTSKDVKGMSLIAIMWLKIKDLQHQINALQSMQYVTDLQTKTTELQNNISALQVQYNDLQIKVSTLQNQVSVINTQLNIY